MNEYDSNRIFDTVKEIGFVKTHNIDEADCYLSVSYTHLMLPTNREV